MLKHGQFLFSTTNVIFVLWIFLTKTPTILGGQGQPWQLQQCQGSTTLRNMTGSIQSNTGALYQDNSRCLWVIDPFGLSNGLNNSAINMTAYPFGRFQITLYFIKFELEHKFDFLSIFANSSTPSQSNLYATFGEIFKFPFRLTINSPIVTLLFSSDALVSLSGFQLAFEVSVNQSCGLHGMPIMGNCVCESGYYYNGNYCRPRNQNNDQECNFPFGKVDRNENQCQCIPPALGRTCGNLVCGDSESYTEPKGTFADHIGMGSYFPRTTCRFALLPNRARAMALWFHFLELGADDQIIIYNDDPSQNPAAQILFSISGPISFINGKDRNTSSAAYTMSNSSLPLIYSFTGRMFLFFNGNKSPIDQLGIRRSGFEASYSSVNSTFPQQSHSLCLPNRQPICDFTPDPPFCSQVDCSLGLCSSSITNNSCCSTSPLNIGLNNLKPRTPPYRTCGVSHSSATTPAQFVPPPPYKPNNNNPHEDWWSDNNGWKPKGRGRKDDYKPKSKDGKPKSKDFKKPKSMNNNNDKDDEVVFYKQKSKDIFKSKSKFKNDVSHNNDNYYKPKSMKDSYKLKPKSQSNFRNFPKGKYQQQQQSSSSSDGDSSSSSFYHNKHSGSDSTSEEIVYKLHLNERNVEAQFQKESKQPQQKFRENQKQQKISPQQKMNGGEQQDNDEPTENEPPFSGPFVFSQESCLFSNGFYQCDNVSFPLPQFYPNNISLCEWEITGVVADSISFVLLAAELDLQENDNPIVTIRSLDKTRILGTFPIVRPQALLPPLAISTKLSPQGFSISMTGSAFFVIYYETSSCPNSCSGNGACIMGVCQCYEGYSGSACESKDYCPLLVRPDRVANLVCTGSPPAPTPWTPGPQPSPVTPNIYPCQTPPCNCAEGFFGPSCLSRYCNGLTTLSNKTGHFRDRGVGTSYAPGSNCTWIIRTNDTNTPITLVFTAFQLSESSMDTLSVYDGESVNSPVLWSGRSRLLPPPIRSTAGLMLVRFTTGLTSTPLYGFRAQYYSNSMCQNGSTSCSQWCLNGQNCSCTNSNPFPNCNNTSPPVGSITLGSTYNASLDIYTWKYYSIVLKDMVGEMTFDFRKISAGGAPQLYIRPRDFPVLYPFPNDQRVFNYFSNSLKVESPNAGTYYIGVFGAGVTSATSTDYSLSIYVGCPNQCNNRGICVNNQNCTCADSQCWSGNDCSTPVVNCGVGGTCSSGICTCINSSYSGPNCLPVCETPCKNGGSCVAPNVCDCSSAVGFGGDFCERPTSCPLNCQHGGTCNVSNQTCNCLPGYTGSYCEKAICLKNCYGNGQCVSPNKCECNMGFGGQFCSDSDHAMASDDGNSRTLVASLIVTACFIILVVGIIIVGVAIVRRTTRNRRMNGAAGE